jgi:hypothetical protein
MSPDERTLIQGLFDRLRQVETQPRDPEAERLILDAVRSQPGAPYYMAQAIIVQEQALQAAQTQIQELERKVSALESGGAREAPAGGFLSSVTGGLFGANRMVPPRSSVPPSGNRYQTAPPPPAQPYAAQAYNAQPPTPAQMAQMQPQSQNGGFLRSAMATAAGVAGGALLFQGISSMFSGQHHNTSNPWSSNPSTQSASGSGQGYSEESSRLAEAEQALVNDHDYAGDNFSSDSDFGGDSMDI